MKILFSMAIAAVLVMMNFYLGLAIISLTALSWGLTTNHWSKKKWA